MRGSHNWFWLNFWLVKKITCYRTKTCYARLCAVNLGTSQSALLLPMVKFIASCVKPRNCFAPYIYMVLLREWRLWKWFTSTAGTLVADKADLRQAGPVAVTADEGQVKVWLHSVTILPPVPFVAHHIARNSAELESHSNSATSRATISQMETQVKNIARNVTPCVQAFSCTMQNNHRKWVNSGFMKSVNMTHNNNLKCPHVYLEMNGIFLFSCKQKHMCFWL